MNIHDARLPQPPPVVQMFKRLGTAEAVGTGEAEQAADAPAPHQVRVRIWQPQQALDVWLRIQNRAFERGSQREWQEKDFRRELESRSWFRESVSWLASLDSDLDEPEGVGSVTLELPTRPGRGSARLHWLAVTPGYRRIGIGRLLVDACVRECERQGVDRIEIETLRSWRAALSFYEALGFQPLHTSG